MTLWRGPEALVKALDSLTVHAVANETTLSIQRTPLGKWVVSLGDLELAQADELEAAVHDAAHWAAVRSW